MKNLEIKVKLIISTLLCLIVISSNIKTKKDEAVQVITNIEPVPKFRLSTNEQQRRFEYLLSGKINKYECESDFKINETGSVVEDTSVFGKGVKVVYCKAGTDKAGYIVKGLSQNIEINDSRNKWMNDSSHTWYIRPRMRIRRDLMFPNIEGYNEENWHTQICRLEVVNTEGEIIDSVEYAAKDFFEKDTEDECRLYYSGNYRDRKSWMNNLDSIIVVSGKKLNPKTKLITANSKLDYRIYWYGFTDLWIDKITVENETASELLAGKYDIWLNSMDSIKVENLNDKNINDNQKECFNYITNRLKQIHTKWAAFK